MINNNICRHIKVSTKMHADIWEPCCDDIKCMYPKHYCLKPNIRKRLLKIAYDFHVFLGVDVPVADVIFTGSLANFNYTEFSDIDLHVLIDYRKINDDHNLVKNHMSAKKTIWNEKHDIKIKGFEVELYAQDTSEAHHSTGVFSVITNSWIVSPEIKSPKIDFHQVMKKSQDMMDRIDRVLSSPNREKGIERIKEKIKNMRQSGLSREGEFSIENLVFKVLRNTGYIGKIYKIANDDYDLRLSIEQ
jgi:hypothetical protein